MRQAIWTGMTGILLAVTGCDEFVTTDKPAPATSVDVVGDPSDPVADSTEESDILAAETMTSEQALADTDSNADAKASTDESSKSPGDDRASDSAASVEKTKAAPLKTTRRESNNTK